MIPNTVRLADSELPMRSRRPWCLVTKSELYSFFRELARSFAPNQPAAAATPETMQQLFEVAAKYGYWLASPAENAAIGLNIV